MRILIRTMQLVGVMAHRKKLASGIALDSPTAITGQIDGFMFFVPEVKSIHFQLLSID